MRDARHGQVCRCANNFARNPGSYTTKGAGGRKGLGCMRGSNVCSPTCETVYNAHCLAGRHLHCLESSCNAAAFEHMQKGTLRKGYSTRGWRTAQSVPPACWRLAQCSARSALSCGLLGLQVATVSTHSETDPSATAHSIRTNILAGHASVGLAKHQQERALGIKRWTASCKRGSYTDHNMRGKGGETAERSRVGWHQGVGAKRWWIHPCCNLG